MSFAMFHVEQKKQPKKPRSNRGFFGGNEN